MASRGSQRCRGAENPQNSRDLDTNKDYDTGGRGLSCAKKTAAQRRPLSSHAADAQDDRIGLRQTEDYCAPRRGGSGHPDYERGGLHLAGQLPAVDNLGGGAACRGSASGEFILPAVPDAARTAVVDRRQLTGKMKSTALEKNTTGSASPRRTIVLSLTTASSVILVLKETEAAKADGR